MVLDPTISDLAFPLDLGNLRSEGVLSELNTDKKYQGILMYYVLPPNLFQPGLFAFDVSRFPLNDMTVQHLMSEIDDSLLIGNSQGKRRQSFDKADNNSGDYLNHPIRKKPRQLDNELGSVSHNQSGDALTSHLMQESAGFQGLNPSGKHKDKVDFNYDSVVQILDVAKNNICVGVIVADRYVVAPMNCDEKRIQFIRYKDDDFNVLKKEAVYAKQITLVHYPDARVLLIKTDKTFETRDFTNLSINKLNLDDQNTLYYNDNCTSKLVMMNYYSFQYRFIVAAPNLQFNFIDQSYSLKTNEGDVTTNPNIGAFLWERCSQGYKLEGIYYSRTKFFHISRFDDNLYKTISDLSLLDRQPNSGISNVKFVDIPNHSDSSVNQLIKNMMNKKWIKYDKVKYAIPFRRINSSQFIFGIELQLMLVYLYEFHKNDSNYEFVKIVIHCKGYKTCFHFQNEHFINHIVLGYMSQEQNKLMVIDPAVSNVAFALDISNLKYHELLNPLTSGEDYHDIISFYVLPPNVFSMYLLARDAYRFPLNDSDSKYIIDKVKPFLLNPSEPSYLLRSHRP